MSFSHSWHIHRNRQVELLSEKLVGQLINVVIENIETQVYVDSVINQQTLHHMSSELIFHCKKQVNDTEVIKIEIWLFIYAGKYRLFQPNKDKTFIILEGDELKKIVT